MSYHIEKDKKTDQKLMVDVKQHRRYHRRTCSTEGCLSQAQRHSLCAKHLQLCDQTISNSSFTSNKTCHQVLRNKKRSMMSKQSQMNRWSTPSETELSTNDSNVSQIKDIFSKIQQQLEQNLNNQIFPHDAQLNVSIDDDAKSESSIEYDYTNPLPLLSTSNIQHRHVSIATIYLQDEQWHQLELFIKHFSSYASLSNNMNVNSSTTHLLIDDSSTPLQCNFSKKIFQAVARHIFIVSIRWMEECLLQNEFLDERPFEIHGDSTMSTMHRARHSLTNPLFSLAVVFAIDCTSFQRTLTRHELAELVVLSGATLFDSDQPTSVKVQSTILLVLADSTADRDRLETTYKQWHKNVKFLTPGFLLKSIVYQEQQPFEDFEL